MGSLSFFHSPPSHPSLAPFHTTLHPQPCSPPSPLSLWESLLSPRPSLPLPSRGCPGGSSSLRRGTTGLPSTTAPEDVSLFQGLACSLPLSSSFISLANSWMSSADFPDTAPTIPQRLETPTDVPSSPQRSSTPRSDDGLSTETSLTTAMVKTKGRSAAR